MAVLGRDDILDAEDLVYELVPVPEWGGDVKIKSLTGEERDQYEGSITRRLKMGQDPEFNLQNLRAKLCAVAIVGENNERLFTEHDIHELGGKSSLALERVFDAARKLAGLTDDDVKELAETFDAAPSDASDSDSPEPLVAVAGS